MPGLEILKESLSRELLEKMDKNKMIQDDVAVNTKFSPADICGFIGKKRNCTLNTVAELAEGVHCYAKIIFIPKDLENI
jgi:hypothetical protein